MIKYWYFDSDGSVKIKEGASSVQESKKVSTSSISGSTNFTSVSSDSKYVYVLSDDGMLYFFDYKRTLIKFIETGVAMSLSMISVDEYLYISGSDGQIKGIAVDTYEVKNLPLPPALG